MKAPNQYDNSVPLDVHKWSPFRQVIAAANLLMEELRTTQVAGKTASGTGKNARKLKKHLKVVLVDLYHNWLIDPSRYIGFSRNNNSYGPQSRQNKLHIRQKYLCEVIDGLHELGYLETVKGFRDRRPGGAARQSRMKSLPKLVDRVFAGYGFTPEIVSNIPGPPIILRDSEGNDLEFQSSDEILQMERNLHAINSLLSRSHIDLHWPDQDFPAVDLRRKLLHRVFNNGSFEEGGRFYGGWWQDVKREYRKHITINGKPTIEVDFSGLHIRLLYAQIGENYEQDPYGFFGAKYRDFLKFVLLVCLNSASFGEAKRAVQGELNKHRDKYTLPPEGHQALVREFIAHHAPLERFFGSGMGTRLQCMDSKIAEEVILKMAESRIPVLPVHDSFICWYKVREELMAVMDEAYTSHAPASEAKYKPKPTIFDDPAEAKDVNDMDLEELAELEYGSYNDRLNAWYSR